MISTLSLQRAFKVYMVAKRVQNPPDTCCNSSFNQCPQLPRKRSEILHHLSRGLLSHPHYSLDQAEILEQKAEAFYHTLTTLSLFDLSFILSTVSNQFFPPTKTKMTRRLPWKKCLLCFIEVQWYQDQELTTYESVKLCTSRNVEVYIPWCT